jgi:hypothetical protein
MSLVSVLNICAWLLVATLFVRVRSGGDVHVHAGRKSQLWLSALFVLGCAFRAILPRAEAQRICLYDSWMSSAFIGRWVATVAELCLVAQLSLILFEYAEGARSRAVVAVSRLLLPLIAIAELFSWYTALTTNFIGSVIEESIWAATSVLMTLGFVRLWPRSHGLQPRRFMTVAVVLNLAYIAFMCSVDIPMYRSRWQADHANGRRYLSLAEGWRDAQRRSTVTRQWQDWRDEIPWMSLYFSAAVWISISLSRVPAFVGATERPSVRI